jgi:pre-mRNA-splicing factor ATP-dependent RNA helicase DHX15/PRP43
MQSETSRKATTIAEASISKDTGNTSSTFKKMSSRKQKIDLGDSSNYEEQGRAVRQRLDEGDALNRWTGKPFSSRYYSILEARTKLPVYQFKDQVLKSLEDNQIIVVEGETGSGKTTQIPQFFLDAGFEERGVIACTQPRRSVSDLFFYL